MKRDEIRQALIDGTIHVIAQDGLDKATTKQIGTETGINEAYIYRCFKDKEDLFVKTFSKLDNELVTEILNRVSVMDMTEFRIEDRCRMLFYFVWKFLVGDSEKCLCFIRYYYSPYFEKYSFEEHKANYRTVVEKFTPAFKQGVDVWLMLNHILDAMLSSAVKVFQKEMPDTDESAEQVYSLVYSAVEPQLSWSKKERVHCEKSITHN